MDCSCGDFVDKFGYGNYTKRAKYGRSLCYVNEPSNCTDLYASRIHIGYSYSFTSCEKNEGNAFFWYFSIWNDIYKIDISQSQIELLIW